MSDVWRYFSKADGKKSCTICNQIYKWGTSTSSLIYHLQRNHGIEVPKQSGSQQQPQVQQSRRDGDLVNMFAKRRKLTGAEEK